MIGRKVKVSRDIQKIFRWHDKLSISCTYWCRLYSQVLHKVVDLPLRPLFMPNDILFPITVTHSPVEFSKQVLFERSTTFPVFRCPCPNLILKHVACTETFQNLWGITLKKQNELHWAFFTERGTISNKSGCCFKETWGRFPLSFFVASSTKPWLFFQPTLWTQHCDEREIENWT